MRPMSDKPGVTNAASSSVRVDVDQALIELALRDAKVASKRATTETTAAVMGVATVVVATVAAALAAIISTDMRLPDSRGITAALLAVAGSALAALIGPAIAILRRRRRSPSPTVQKLMREAAAEWDNWGRLPAEARTRS